MTTSWRSASLRATMARLDEHILIGRSTRLFVTWVNPALVVCVSVCSVETSRETNSAVLTQGWCGAGVCERVVTQGKATPSILAMCPRKKNRAPCQTIRVYHTKKSTDVANHRIEDKPFKVKNSSRHAVQFTQTCYVFCFLKVGSVVALLGIGVL